MTFIREKKALMEGIDIQHILRATLSHRRLDQLSWKHSTLCIR